MMTFVWQLPLSVCAPRRLSSLYRFLVVIFFLGVGITAPSIAATDCDMVVVVAETQPQLVGGMDHLYAQARYPDRAREEGVEGRVFVQFIVGRQGEVHDPNVTRGVHPDLDAEAIRVIQTARFTPGVHRGQPICVQMSLPIAFRLDDPRLQTSASPASVATALRPVDQATESVEAASESVTSSVTDKTSMVDSTATSVENAATNLSDGITDTKESVSDSYSATTESLTEAKESVSKTFRGLFGRKKKKDEPAAPEARADAPEAVEAIAAGEVLMPKLDNVTIHTEPSADAPVLVRAQAADALVYLGDDRDGYLYVQTTNGAGWINHLLVTRK